jgi:hypothetical protein
MLGRKTVDFEVRSEIRKKEKKGKEIVAGRNLICK